MLGAAPGWGSCLIIINTVSSSVCPALRVVPEGRGGPRQISGGVPLYPFPLWGHCLHCAEVAQFMGGCSGLAAPSARLLPAHASGS